MNLIFAAIVLAAVLTAAGRQMNRRVEVVFAPEAGDILTLTR